MSVLRVPRKHPSRLLQPRGPLFLLSSVSLHSSRRLCGLVQTWSQTLNSSPSLLCDLEQVIQTLKALAPFTVNLPPGSALRVDYDDDAENEHLVPSSALDYDPDPRPLL